MILTDAKLLEIIVKKPNKKLLEWGSEQRKIARRHIYGVGLADSLPKIEGFERDFIAKLRLKYALSNKDLFARLEKPIEKIFTARGGATYYNLGDKLTPRVAEKEGRVRNGLSSKKWIENYWKPHMMDDPMGMIFMEINAASKVYPTYKSVDCVFDYMLDGTGFEYIIFKVENEEKARLNLKNEEQVFRVVDDAFDRYVIWNGKTDEGSALTNVEGETYVNYFRDVPAIVNGFLINPDGEGFLSLYDKVFDLAENHMVQMSIKITHNFQHGFPKYYEMADDCIECHGTGKINGKKHEICGGSGKRLMTRPSDVKLMEYPTKDTPGIRGAPGGYIEPSKVYWEIVSNELAELEQKVNQTIWGSKVTSKLKKGMGLSSAPNGTSTATEVMDNRQPEIERLHAICDAAQARDKFILDHIIQIEFKQPNYVQKGGCSKTYGRRFLIEEPDALLERYTNGRKEGLSPVILYGMYEQYIESKYQSDNVSLSMHKKLMKVEPFMHNTLSELKLNGATPEEIRRKQYYGEWLVSVNGDWLIVCSVEEAITAFDKYVTAKPLPVVEKEKEKVA